MMPRQEGIPFLGRGDNEAMMTMENRNVNGRLNALFLPYQHAAGKPDYVQARQHVRMMNQYDSLNWLTQASSRQLIMKKLGSVIAAAALRK
jgi:hypothetical protein